MYIDNTFFEQNIINLVGVNHSQEEIDEIVRLWKVPKKC